MRLHNLINSQSANALGIDIGFSTSFSGDLSGEDGGVDLGVFVPLETYERNENDRDVSHAHAQ